MRHELTPSPSDAKPWLQILSALLVVATTSSLLVSCSGTDAETIHLTGQNGDVSSANKNQDSSIPLTQKDLKLQLVQELMRFHATSKNLIQPPAATAAAFAKGCVLYQPSNLEDRNLRTTYACAWMQPSRDGKSENQWILTNNEDYAPAFATDASKTVEAKATLAINVHTAKTHTLRRAEAYNRDTKVTAKDSTTFIVKGQSNVSSPTRSANSGFQGGDLAGYDPDSQSDADVTAMNSVVPFPPHRPTPHPTPASKATDSWTASLDGYWTQDKTALDLEKGGELIFTYKASATADAVVLTMYSSSAITFNEADNACPLPTGTFSWSSQTGSAAAVSGTLTLDAKGITDNTGGTDAIPWPTDSCLEFTANKAQ